MKKMTQKEIEKQQKKWLEDIAETIADIANYSEIYNAKYTRILTKDDLKRKFIRNKELFHTASIDCGVYSESSVVCSTDMLEHDKKIYLFILQYIKNLKDVISRPERIDDIGLEFYFDTITDYGSQMSVSFDINFHNYRPKLIKFKLRINEGGEKREVGEAVFVRIIEEQIEIIDKKIEWLNEEIDAKEWKNWAKAPAVHTNTSIKRKINV